MIKEKKFLIIMGLISLILFLLFFTLSFYSFNIPLRNQNYDYYSFIDAEKLKKNMSVKLWLGGL